MLWRSTFFKSLHAWAHHIRTLCKPARWYTSGQREAIGHGYDFRTPADTVPGNSCDTHPVPLATEDSHSSSSLEMP